MQIRLSFYISFMFTLMFFAFSCMERIITACSMPFLRKEILQWVFFQK